MKKLLIFEKGAVLIEENSLLDIEIDGQKPISKEKPTARKLKKYFKELKPDSVIIKGEEITSLK